MAVTQWGGGFAQQRRIYSPTPFPCLIMQLCCMVFELLNDRDRSWVADALKLCRPSNQGHRLYFLSEKKFSASLAHEEEVPIASSTTK